jgi:DNA-binding transcriptional ArsR family regulator
MALSEAEVNIIGIILNTWAGMHKTRRRVGLCIAECYILLSCVWLEKLNKPISEGSVRGLTLAYHWTYLHKLFLLLLDKGYISLSRQSDSKRYTYYSLTDKGRELAEQLLNGIEARQVAFFNKYLK